jgi:hypothetical protein
VNGVRVSGDVQLPVGVADVDLSGGVVGHAVGYDDFAHRNASLRPVRST